jgi:hypothetical protein
LFRTIAQPTVPPLCAHFRAQRPIGFVCTTDPDGGTGRHAGPGVGFVSPRSLACAIHHNSFPAKCLPLLSLGRNWLCLYNTPCPPSPAPAEKLGLFRTFRPARSGLTSQIGFVRHACLRPNWVCFARFAPGRRSSGMGVPPMQFTGKACPRSEAEGMPVPRGEPRIGFVLHDRSIATWYIKHQTSHFRLLPSMPIPLIAAVLQESVRKNGFRHPPKLP